MSGPERYPCPCCGYVVLDAPGANEICPICLWEDDVVQLRWPDWPGGANTPSLVEAQEHYARTGACEVGALPYVRAATDADRRDPDWRPADHEVDAFEPRSVQEADWPDDPTVLYWWRPTFWRQRERPR